MDIEFSQIHEMVYMHDIEIRTRKRNQGFR